MNKLHSFTFEPQKGKGGGGGGGGGGGVGAESIISCDQALRPRVGFFTLLQKEEI